MADQDYWSSFNPQPADAVAQPAQHSPHSTTDDYWQQYSPQPAASISGAPAALAERLSNGHAAGEVADKSGEKQDMSWHYVWDSAKKGAAAGLDLDGLNKSVAEQREALGKFLGPGGDKLGGWTMLENGSEALQAGYGLLKGAFRGAANAGMATINKLRADSNIPGVPMIDLDHNPITTPYSDVVPSVTDMLAQAAMLKAAPMIVGRGGQMSRVRVNEETGKLEAKEIGGIPQPADFVSAARDIAPEAPPNVQLQVQQRLQDLWHDYGRHPNEVVEATQNSSVMKSDIVPKEAPVAAKAGEAQPQSVGAAATPRMPLPDRPSRAYLKETDDQFFALRGEHIADKAEMAKRLKDMGPLDREMDERLYAHGERDPMANLEPGEKEFFDQHLKPLQDEQTSLFARLSKAGFNEEDIDPIMHRQVRGLTPQLDRLAGVASKDSSLPQEAPGGPGLFNRTTSSLKQASYYALESADGQRKLVTMSKDRMTLRGLGPDKGLEVASEQPHAVGSEVKVGDETYKVVRPFTREIEENTGTRYYKSAVASLMDNVMRLRAAERATYAVQRLRDTPEWEQYTARGPSLQHPEWITPEMPMFKNDYMDPKLAHIIDDFWGSREHSSITDALEKINRVAINSLFWTPIPHALNHFGFWATERGWDWLKPTAYKDLALTTAQALKEVVTQGKRYQDMMRSGASLQYGPIATRDFMPKMMQNIGQEIAKQEGGQGWEHLAKAVGVAPAELVKGFYNASNSILWASGDVMKVQRILELEKQGMSTKEAIAEVDKFTPAYRFPSEILGSNTVSKVFRSNAVFEFSRYHWDIMKMYGNMTKDLAVGNSEQRIRAAGTLFGLAGMQLAVWPAMNAMWQHYVNEEQRVPSFGPGRITEPVWAAIVNHSGIPFPKMVTDYYKDNNKTWLDALRGLVPFSPGAQIAAGALSGKEWHSGRNIVEPDDMSEGRYGRVAAQAGQFGAGILAEPYKVFSDAWKWGESAKDVLTEQIFGMQNASEDKAAAKEKSERYNRRAARVRARKPTGYLESLGD